MYKVFVDKTVKTYAFTDEKKLLTEFAGHQLIEAAGGIVAHEGKYLFIKRLGVWDLPKGKREEGEIVEQAAVREIEEECGLVAPTILRHLTDTWHTYEREGKRVLKKTYWFYLNASKKEQQLSPQVEEGIEEVRYFGAGELQKVVHNTYPSVKEVLRMVDPTLVP